MKKVILFVKAGFKIGNPGYVPTIVVDKHGKRTTVYKLAGDRESSRHVEKRDIAALYQYAISTFTGDSGPMHVVTIHVDESKKKP